MNFVGKVWKILVGIKDGLVLLFMLLFFVALFAILSARPNPGQVREGALLIDLDGIVVEEKSVLDPIETLLSGTAPIGEYRSRDIVRALDAAAVRYVVVGGTAVVLHARPKYSLFTALVVSKTLFSKFTLKPYRPASSQSKRSISVLL